MSKTQSRRLRASDFESGELMLLKAAASEAAFRKPSAQACLKAHTHVIWLLQLLQEKRHRKAAAGAWLMLAVAVGPSKSF